MVNILFSGCSFAAGTGLVNEKTHELHYANVLSKELFTNQAVINNIGGGGNSNLRIFLDTGIELVQKQYDFAFVGWTSYPRHVFWAGLEEYESRRSISPTSTHLVEHNGNDISFSKEFLKDFGDKFLLVHNTHYDILDLVKYINILKGLADSKNTKIYFLNNLCQWDQNYFDPVSDPIPTNLTNYTNKLLNSEHRDDAQIKNLYNKIHNDYKNSGSIQQNLWLNLYQSFASMMIDYGNDKRHPGPLSHQRYGKFLASTFKKLSV